MTTDVAKRINVLLVEDDFFSQKLIERMLEKSRDPQFRVYVAPSLSRAFDRLSCHSVQAVLLDLNLPDKQGIETLKLFRDKHPYLPIIVITGRKTERFGIALMANGAQDYFLKAEFSYNELIKSILHAIERKQIKNELQQSEELYKHILSIISDAVIITKYRGKFTFVCDYIDDIFGYSQEEVLRMENVKNLFGKSLISIAMLKEKGEIKNILESIVDKHGKPHTLLVTARLVEIGEGKVMYVLRDVTEQKRMEEEAQIQQKQLVRAAKMVALGTLVAGVAHEVNNPNNFIMLNAPILKEAWDDAAHLLEKYYQANGEFALAGIPYTEMKRNIPELFMGIFEGSKRIKDIVNDLKDYVREDSSDLDQMIDVNKCVQSAVRLVKNQIKKSTRFFSVDYGMDLILIKGNFQRLEQVIINLLLNSCQALKNPNQKIEVSTEYDEQKQHILLIVADQGRGIPANQQPYVLDPFFTTKRSSGGTGLGLAISDRIVRDHGGVLTFLSEENKGTIVCIRIPVVKEVKSENKKSS